MRAVSQVRSKVVAVDTISRCGECGRCCGRAHAGQCFPRLCSLGEPQQPHILAALDSHTTIANDLSELASVRLQPKPCLKTPCLLRVLINRLGGLDAV